MKKTRRHILGLLAAAPALPAFASLRLQDSEEDAFLQFLDSPAVGVSGELIWTPPERGAASRIWRPAPSGDTAATYQVRMVMANPEDRQAFSYARGRCQACAGPRCAAVLLAAWDWRAYDDEKRRRPGRLLEEARKSTYCTVELRTAVPPAELADMVQRLSVTNPGAINADALDVFTILRGGCAGWYSEYVGAGEARVAEVHDWVLEELAARSAERQRTEAVLLTLSGPGVTVGPLRKLLAGLREYFADDAPALVIDHEDLPTTGSVLAARLWVIG